MPAVASVEVRVDARDAKQQLQGLENASNSAKSAFGKLSQAGSTLQGALAGIGAGALLKGFVSAGIEADRTAKRLNLLASQYGETAKLTKFAQDAAQKYGIGNTAAANAVSDLYGRLRPMGISLKDIQTTFNGVNTAAAKMNLSTADTEGVMLQLSQALGSGKLQGDEFRSIMERLPAVGQAIAKSMGVSVAQLKELSGQGKITTEEIIKALGGLAQQQPPPPDAYKLFQKALADLGTTIGSQILPALTPLVQLLGQIALAFGQLPGPVQSIVVGVIALSGGLAVIAPLLAPIMSLFGAIVPIITGVVTALTGSGGLLAALAAVFTGPVGWIALLIAAGVAIYAFRDQIGQAFAAIDNYFRQAASGFKMVFIDPVAIAMKGLVDGIKSLFSGLAAALRAPFQAVATMIKGIVNGIIGGIERGINGAINALNSMIRGANAALARLKLPTIPTIPAVQLPRFAEGGMVTGPTVAMIGEGGEPEYIIPQSKAAGFAANYLTGKRGAGAIPGFADGGYVAPSSANVSIQTGPVTQMNGTNYVTTQDMGKAVQAGIQQTLDLIRRDGNVRTQLGLA